MSKKIFFLFLLTFSIIHITSSIAEGTVRYVSKTGSSTPPYTSWETAADSIQKAIDICVTGDTVIVANGTYNESISVIKSITLLGSSADSTIIIGNLSSANRVVSFQDYDSSFENFTIRGPGKTVLGKSGLNIRNCNVESKNCIITDVYTGVSLNYSSSIISNLLIYNTSCGIRDECPADTCNAVYLENIIISNNNGGTPTVDLSFGGYPTFISNILIEEGTASWIGLQSVQKPGAVIKNNLFSNYKRVGIQIGTVTTVMLQMEMEFPKFI
jgi:hypothetical protein